MKTSNKLLLGVFLTGLFIITAWHIAIYAKYKAGAITRVEQQPVEKYNYHKVAGNASYLLIKDVQGLFVGQADSIYLNIEKESAGYIQYVMKGDTLVIQGDSAYNSQYNIIGAAMPVAMLNLPVPAKIIALNSNIALNATHHEEEKLVYQVALENSYLALNTRNVPGDSVYITRLTVTATGSTIELNQYQHIQELNLTLKNSALKDDNSRVKKIALVVDDSSSVELSGKNLKYTNLIINGSN